jgi:hypothetical protein
MTMIPQPARPSSPVVLDPDEAVDLAHLLDLIEDWLTHADDDARDDLAHYLDGSGNGHLAAAGLLRVLDHTTAGLHRRLKQARQWPPATGDRPTTTR